MTCVNLHLSVSVMSYVHVSGRISSACSRTMPTWSWRVWSPTLEGQCAEKSCAPIGSGEARTTRNRRRSLRAAILSTCIWQRWTTPWAHSCRTCRSERYWEQEVSQQVHKFCHYYVICIMSLVLWLLIFPLWVGHFHHRIHLWNTSNHFSVTIYFQTNVFFPAPQRNHVSKSKQEAA